MIEAIIESEKEFLETLASTKKIIFNWGEDSLWVIKDGDDSIPENRLSVQGERYHEITHTPAITSADTVCVLIRQGYEVEIRNCKSCFPDEAAIAVFMAEARALVPKNKK